MPRTFILRGQSMESNGIIDSSFFQLSSSACPDHDKHTLAQTVRLGLSKS